MSGAHVGTFEDALRAHDVTSSRTTAEGAADAIAAAVEEPAVGTPLPFADVSLPAGVQANPTPRALEAARTGVTAAGAGIAAYGTVLIGSRPAGEEPVSLYPERHVCVVGASDLVEDVREAMSWVAAEFAAGRRSVVLATGPSATADMGSLVQGVHGPGEVHVVIVTDR